LVTAIGGTATFTVVLDTAPTGDVTIALTSTDTANVTTDPAQVVFTSSNWNTAQTVTVTGHDDIYQDGVQIVQIKTAPATSTDAAYNGLDAEDVVVENVDTHTAGITVTPTTGLVTSAAGAQATFSVVLNTRPTSHVAVQLTSSNSLAGTVSATPLSFSPLDWNTAQTVTVTGAYDPSATTAQTYNIVTHAAQSDDPAYAGFDAADVSLTNQVATIVTSSASVVTSANGASVVVGVSLSSPPLQGVTITATSNDTNNGTVSGSPLTFTTTNWNTPQNITITGGALVDNAGVYHVTLDASGSADPIYAAIAPVAISAVNAAVLSSPVSGDTTRIGGTATVTFTLSSAPSAPVTIPLSLDVPAEALLSDSQVVLDGTNWNTGVVVTVTGQDDGDTGAGGSVVYHVVTGASTSTDANYVFIDALTPDVQFSNDY
jgi:hypothetical protein